MHPNRTAALALVTGAAAGLVTMILHPTGTEVMHDASAGGANTVGKAVHALAIVTQPLVLAGALALTARLRARRDAAVAAYVFFALATVAVIIAAAASGFLAPGALEGLAEADAAERVLMMHAFHYTGLLNQTFAKIYVAFSGIAIALWSIAILAGREMTRGLGAFGLMLGTAMAVAVAAGMLRLDIHGFGAVVLGIGVWLVWAAVQLWRGEED